MSWTRGFCSVLHCWRRAWHDQLCAHHGNYLDPYRDYTPRPGPLVCDCPTPTDECARCRRVIAEAVHTRRAAR